MSPAEVQRTIHSCDFYVEFGNLPGKDRLPREALASGIRIFLRTCGDGSFEHDWLLPSHAYFTTEDCLSGELHRRILRYADADDEQSWQAARLKVARERQIFRDECAQLVRLLETTAVHSSGQMQAASRIDRFPRPEDELSSAERRLAAVQTSTSWRATEPLRNAIARLQGIPPEQIR